MSGLPHLHALKGQELQGGAAPERASASRPGNTLKGTPTLGEAVRGRLRHPRASGEQGRPHGRGRFGG